MAKIILKKEECISCGSCSALCPDFWKMPDSSDAGQGGNNEEMKINLKGSKKNEETGEWELEVADIACNQDAVDCCPVQVIKIVD